MMKNMMKNMMLIIMFFMRVIAKEHVHVRGANHGTMG
jgi:hypothetical protein